MPIVELTVYVQPNARKTEISGRYGEYVKIRIQAPPVDDQANAVLIQFLAEIFDIRLSSLQLIRGQKSRVKTIRMHLSEKIAKQKNELLKSARVIED
jgi:uncharacterized protein